jgi:pyruvate kinase
MLSEETAIGNFPVLVVQTMRQIAETIDKENFERHEYTHLNLYKDALKGQAVELAKMIDAKAIISLTETGSTAFKISRFKNSIPVIAIVDKLSVANYLSLAHGVSVLVEKTLKDIPDLRKKIEELSRVYGFAKE